MKKTITAIILTLCFAAAVPFAGCAKTDTTKKPENSPSVNTPIETPSPITQSLAGNYVGHINAAGIKSCDADFARTEYDADLKTPYYYIAAHPDDIIKQALTSMSTNASHKQELGKYDESYFEKYTVIVLRIPANSGSTILDLSKVTVKDGKLSIYVNSSKPTIGTADMATFTGLISLYKGDFKDNMPIEVYFNDTLISAGSNSDAE